MTLLDRDITQAKALVIDSAPTSRSVLATMLRQFGFGTVAQAARLEDARRALENQVYDLVLCDFHFEGRTETGQDLLDDLRRAQLLPLSTVFIMVTGEATYATVAEAAESALDCYLLKPHSAAMLAERITQARHRKRVLRSVFDAIEAGDFEQAAAECQARFQARGAYWLYAARLGAELLIRLGRHDDARELLQAVVQCNALPWAKLGIARAHMEGKDLPQARRTLEALLVEHPTYADAFDVMGRVQVEQGDLQLALETYRQASKLTPSSIQRLQKQGMLAFYLGQGEEAARSLERAASLGAGSKMFDMQSMVMLAMLRFDARDSKGVQRCLDSLLQALEKAPESRRLQRFVLTVRIFKSLLERQLARLITEVRELADESRNDGFDFEAACNLLAVVARLSAAEIQLPDAELWLRDVSLRFSTSRAYSELLAQAALAHPPSAEIVRAGHQAITARAEQAMGHTLAGEHGEAVQALVRFGEETRNLKLVEMAALALARHRTRIADAESLERSVDGLRRRLAQGGHQGVLGRNSQRPEGGLAIKGQTPAAEAAAAPATPAPST